MLDKSVRNVLKAFSLILFLVILTGVVLRPAVLYAQDPGTNKASAAYGEVATAAPGFDFNLSNSGNVTVADGGAVSTNITVTLVTGLPEPVSLSCSQKLPAGAICLFNVSSGLPTFTSTLIIVATSSTPAGSYTITVIGSGGGVTHTTEFTLRVNPLGTVRLGGSVLPIDFLRLLLPYIVLAAAAAASAGVFLRLRKRRNQ